MEWQKFFGFLARESATQTQTIEAGLSAAEFDIAYREWLIEQCQHLSDVAIGPLNKSVPLIDLYCQPQLQTLNTDKPENLNINELMSNHKHLLITGVAGSGKTTLCRFLALKAASFQSTIENETLAFFIPLKRLNYTQEIDSNNDVVTLETILKLILPPHLPVGAEVEAYVNEKLAVGNCLFLFDGLDDIDDPNVRNHWLAGIANFTELYAHNYIIITDTHTHSQTEHEIYKDIATYTLAPMTVSAIESYLHKHCDFINSNIDLDKPLDSTVLLKQIKANPDLLTLCQNPMMLCMNSALFTDQVALEAEQATLFENYIKQSTLWYCPPNCTPPQWEGVLERTAYTMHKNASAYIRHNWCKQIMMSEFDSLNHVLSPDELDAILETCSNSKGIFNSVNTTDIFEYSHQSFQDFLTAKQLHQKGYEGLSQLKSGYLSVQTKHVLSFYVMLAKESTIKADEIIHWLLSLKDTSALLFASSLALQSKTISGIAAERIFDQLENLRADDLNNYGQQLIDRETTKLAKKYTLGQELVLTQS